MALLLAIGSVVSTAATTSPAFAQDRAAADTITGRIIASDSTPIPFARVDITVARQDPIRITADSAGRYRAVVSGGSGTFVLRVSAFGYATFQVEIERLPGSRRIERDIRLRAQAITLNPVVVNGASDRGEDPPPAPGSAVSSWSSFLSDALPVQAGDFAGIAALAPGVVRLGGGDLTLSIAGQSPLQNQTTVDGASFGGGGLPSEAVRNTSVYTTTYDVAHGQFSGGRIAATTISGTNRWGGALSTTLTDPALQFGSERGELLDPRTRNMRLAAGGGGALRRDRLFVYGALDLSRVGSMLRGLSLSDPGGLRRLGLSPDSALRFLEIAEQLGLVRAGAGTGALVHRESLSGLARVDYALSRHHEVTTRLDLRASRASGIGTSPFRLATATSNLRSTDAGVFVQLISGWGSTSNTARVYSTSGTQHASNLAAPAGEVYVSSLAEDMTSGGSILGFGGLSLGLPTGSRSLQEFADELVHESADGAHRVKTGILLQRQNISVITAANASGTFSFGSLADLESGRPSAFTRTIGSSAAAVYSDYAALYAGDTWKTSEKLRIVYGLRLEGSRFGSRRPLAVALDSLGIEARSAAPSDLLVSPRIGFRFDGRGRGSVTVQGGIGSFRGRVPLEPLAAPWQQTGSAEQLSLTCVGAATPRPEWQEYAADPASIPTQCADGSLALADRAPTVTLFDPGFAAPRTLRASLGASAAIGPRAGLHANGVIVHGTRLPSSEDLNLVSVPLFMLTGEESRPVYAPLAAIDPTSGMIAAGGSRRVRSLGSVLELGSRGESWTYQLTTGASGILGRDMLVDVSYRFTRSRTLEGALPAPGAGGASTRGNPNSLEWATSSFEQPHAFQLLLENRITPKLRISAVARLASGLPFTPTVAGDINGDGVVNDRAFVFSPGSAGDSLVGQGVSELLSNGPGAVRECLRRQISQIAARNSCRTPWSPSLDFRADLIARGNVNSRKLVVSMLVLNATAGLDFLLHGPNGVRGWGQYPQPDPVLLYVRGFSPESRSFRYDVNSRFGRPQGGGVFSTPATIVLQARLVVGADPVYQPLLRAIELGGRTARASVRTSLSNRVRNVPGSVLALDAAEPGTLALTTDQRSRLRATAGALQVRLDRVLDELSASLTAQGPMTAARQASIQDASNEARTLIDEGLHAAQTILTREQWMKLPRWLVTPPPATDLETPPELSGDIPEGAP